MNVTRASDMVLFPNEQGSGCQRKGDDVGVAASADVRGAAVQLWTAVLDRSHTRYAMRQPMPATRDAAVVLLVQPRDDGLHMYAEYLCEYGLSVIAVSEAWDALIAAPKADVIVTGILLVGSMDGVELIARLRRDHRCGSQAHHRADRMCLGRRA